MAPLGRQDVDAALSWEAAGAAEGATASAQPDRIAREAEAAS